jgi:hypothetical protein
MDLIKKLLGLIVLALLLSGNAYSKDGTGDLRFTSKSFNSFLAYLRGDGSDIGGVMMSSGTPTGFAINQKGNNTYYFYCPKKYGGDCQGGGHIRAQNSCSNRSKKMGEGRCFVFANKRLIVWDSVNYKIKKNPSVDEIKELFAKYGWYGSAENKEIIKSKITKKKKEAKKVVKKYELKGERSIALSWEGYEDLIAGKVNFDETDYKGTLNLPLPNNEGTCDGTYSLQKGGKGTWQIACSNNMGAAGTLKWVEDGGVTGTGRDHNDKKVKFTVSKNG